MPLRLYQQRAFDAALKFTRKSTQSCVIDAATGAGKSHIIAALAEAVHELSKKRVLILAPRSKLVEQNVKKYRATGHKCSIYSASAGSKCLRYPVVFGTPQTIANSINKFGDYAMVIIDECHGITPTIKKIVESMKKQNPNLRVVGLTATPFRLGTGYIYSCDINDVMLDEKQAINPYFYKCIYKIDANELIRDGYLTSPVVGSVKQHYDTSKLVLLPTGKYSTDSVEEAFIGHGRLTSQIIVDVVFAAKDRKAVLFFASTIKHAEEIMSSLPENNSRLITSQTKEKEKQGIYRDFDAMKFKYLVNVDMLTTGFDAPHIDVIALLRHTESAALLQQIIGRGLRLYEGKKDCIILDYAENIENHYANDNLFESNIKTTKKTSEHDLIKVKCPLCQKENNFILKPNPNEFNINENGFFIDLDGHVIDDLGNKLSAHFGRRCKHIHKTNNGYRQCEYRWENKTCPTCLAENDIAAKYCSKCNGELVNPNDKLNSTAYKLNYSDQYKTEHVIAWKKRNTLTRHGSPCLIVEYTTVSTKFSIWYLPKDSRRMPFVIYDVFCKQTNNGQIMPTTITYRKNPSGFYEILAYNKKVDEND